LLIRYSIQSLTESVIEYFGLLVCQMIIQHDSELMSQSVDQLAA